jgi:hypothetical protein
MFSEHFRDELRGQMARAPARGANNSHELHCSLGDFPGADHTQSLASRRWKSDDRRRYLCCPQVEQQGSHYPIFVATHSFNNVKATPRGAGAALPPASQMVELYFRFPNIVAHA